MIGIVGFGACGLSCLIQIVEKCIYLGKVVDVHYFDNTHKFENSGIGKAFGTKSSSHLLNLDTHTMNCVHTKSDHFYDWFQSSKTVWSVNFPNSNCNDKFPPRGIFGMYLTSMLIYYTDLAAVNGINVVHHDTYIVSLNLQIDKVVELIDYTGAMYKVNYCILALGNFPSDLYEEFRGISGYYHCPYDSIVVKPDDIIVILGSRLTAIDTVLHLCNELHWKNKIYMVSRSGLLPKIIGPSVPYKLQFISKEAILNHINTNGIISGKTIADLFRQEMELVTNKSFQYEELFTILTDCPVIRLKDEIETIYQGEIRMWQSVLIAFYPIVPWVWSLLSSDDKKHFLDHYLSLWLVYLAAFPLENAEKLLELLISEQVELINGLRSVQYDSVDNMFNVNCCKKIKANIVINATGPGHSLRHSPLLLNMHELGIISQPEWCEGVLIEPSTSRVISKHQQPHRNLFCIGEITFGTRLATADLSQVSMQAENAVNTIFEML